MFNKRFGKLTVIGSAPSILQTNGKRKGVVIARCDCGTIKTFIGTNVRNGNSKSCGCAKFDGMKAFNVKRAIPQKWIIDRDTAYIFVRKTKILVDVADIPIVGKYKWGLRNGYAMAKGGRLAMHRMLLGLENGDPREGDHVHHNITDNRRSELRVANSSQNKMNRHGNVVATSRYKGVHYDRKRSLFVAQIGGIGSHRFLGRFETEIEAASAYNAAALKHFGKFAYLNPI